MSYETLGIEAAAKILRCNIDTARRLAAKGKIPASKPAREWVFDEEQLRAYVRGEWQSTNDRPADPGGLDSKYVVNMFARAPGPQIETKPKNSRQPFGIVTGGKHS